MSVAPTQPRSRPVAPELPQRDRKLLRSVESGAIVAAGVDASTAPPDESAEMNRWLLFLVPPFLVSALFFTIAIGTSTPELIAPALFFGPMLIILAFIYLGLSSESNSE